jgi:large subunit ribosomal protein L22
MEVKAMVKNVNVPPRKARWVLEHLPGRRVEEALTLLKHMTTPGARVVAKVVKAAAANAENNFQMVPEELRVKAAYADEARRLRRFRPRARGRVSPIIRRSSHITVVVEEQEV